MSSRGLVVKTEDSWPRGPGFKPPLWRPFSGTIHLDQSLTLTWHCCICCNPANGRVDFEEWSAYKIQLHGIEWIVSLSADWDKQTTNKKTDETIHRCTNGGLPQKTTKNWIIKRQKNDFFTTPSTPLKRIWKWLCFYETIQFR